MAIVTAMLSYYNLVKQKIRLSMAVCVVIHSFISTTNVLISTKSATYTSEASGNCNAARFRACSNPITSIPSAVSYLVTLRVQCKIISGNIDNCKYISIK